MAEMKPVPLRNQDGEVIGTGTVNPLTLKAEFTLNARGVELMRLMKIANYAKYLTIKESITNDDV